MFVVCEEVLVFVLYWWFLIRLFVVFVVGLGQFDLVVLKLQSIYFYFYCIFVIFFGFYYGLVQVFVDWGVELVLEGQFGLRECDEMFGVVGGVDW